MKIGIDFDNTIASYDTLFHEVALRENFISRRWSGCGKTELRNYLRAQPDGEKTWMKLQGLVYGKYMHLAKLMPNVANFLLSCNVRNHELFIISHKTEYGHYYPEHISLRKKALKWMDANRFFDLEYFGIDKRNVFFADTREEKVEKIAHLKCNWFIDDLPEVFEEHLFPLETNKILFGSYEPLIFSKITVLNSWEKISKNILGQTTDKDITTWANRIMEKPIHHIEKIAGRGNSKVYKIKTTSEDAYALKQYPNMVTDKRPRLTTEFNTLQLLHQHNITHVPKSIEKSEELNIGLYEWIDGENVVQPNLDDLEQAIAFVKQLHILSQNIDKNNINIASECCLSVDELVNQIDNRLLKLENNSFQELSTFIETVFKPLWTEAKDKSLFYWSIKDRGNLLPVEKQTLSPSDFGFHNSIKMDDGSLTFLDFDYFGWDDPVKLTADFIWHPAMNLDKDQKDIWQKAMLEIFNNDKSFEDRLNATMPLYGLRWALIILNEFLPGFADRRKEAGESKSYEIKKARQIQLVKAHTYCEKVKTMVSQVAFA
jgi:hypothetical protein